MLIDFNELSTSKIYHLMIQTVIPRPIAWVLSDSGDAKLNLAPFSYFNSVSSNPPLLMICVGRKKDGSKKDTWKNIEENKDFVVHIGNSETLEAINATSESLPHGESEIEKAGLQTVAVEGYRLPRVEGPRAAFFCEKYAIHEIGEAPQGLIFGKIHGMWVDDSISETKDDRVFISAKKLDPPARLGGEDYAFLGEMKTLKKPY